MSRDGIELAEWDTISQIVGGSLQSDAQYTPRGKEQKMSMQDRKPTVAASLTLLAGKINGEVWSSQEFDLSTKEDRLFDKLLYAHFRLRSEADKS